MASGHYTAYLDKMRLSERCHLARAAHRVQLGHDNLETALVEQVASNDKFHVQTLNQNIHQLDSTRLYISA
jgi:hypothetical protein